MTPSLLDEKSPLYTLVKFSIIHNGAIYMQLAYFAGSSTGAVASANVDSAGRRFREPFINVANWL
jgi:hypothetical protein